MREVMKPMGIHIAMSAAGPGAPVRQLVGLPCCKLLRILLCNLLVGVAVEDPRVDLVEGLPPQLWEREELCRLDGPLEGRCPDAHLLTRRGKEGEKGRERAGRASAAPPPVVYPAAGGRRCPLNAKEAEGPLREGLMTHQHRGLLKGQREAVKDDVWELLRVILSLTAQVRVPTEKLPCVVLRLACTFKGEGHEGGQVSPPPPARSPSFSKVNDRLLPPPSPFSHPKSAPSSLSSTYPFSQL